MIDVNKTELLPQTTYNTKPAPDKPVLSWDLGKTLLANTLAKRGNGVEAAVARVASSWVAEYVPPESVEAPQLRDQPILAQREQQLGEIKKALLLAKQSLMVFASNHPQFHLVGGLAFPMDLMFRANLTPEQIVSDKAALHMLAYFIKESGRCFKGVSGWEFIRNGSNKQVVIGDYEQTYTNLVETWKVPEEQWEAAGGWGERIQWSKR